MRAPHASSRWSVDERVVGRRAGLTDMRGLATAGRGVSAGADRVSSDERRRVWSRLLIVRSRVAPRAAINVAWSTKRFGVGYSSRAASLARSAEDVPSSVELRWRPGEHQAALTL